jgi:hypothetical protein
MAASRGWGSITAGLSGEADSVTLQRRFILQWQLITPNQRLSIGLSSLSVLEKRGMCLNIRISFLMLISLFIGLMTKP